MPSLPSLRSVCRAVRCAAACAVLLLVAGVARAGAQDGDELTIYHVTMGQGDAVYERFGHNAIWVHDPVLGTDHVYNYGVFDFDEPGYWSRFVKGDWIYSVRADGMRETLYVYSQLLNRSVLVQELNLTAAQRAALRDFLEWNVHEENRYYLYDYYYDNCSTRVRDALDHALGGQLRAATADSVTDKSFRWHSERLVAGDPATYTGLLVGLGPAADRPITAWEEMFLPSKVQEQLGRLQVRGEHGELVPLVRSEQILFRAERVGEREVPPRVFGWYLLVGLLLAALLMGLAALAARGRGARLGFAVAATLWAAFSGTAGLLLFGLWAFTNHAIAYRNENLLQLNPLMLCLVLLVPAITFGARWAARPARWLALGLAGLSLLGLLLKMLPAFGQANLPLIALALPVNLGLAWAILRLSDAAAAPLPAERPARAAPPARGTRRGARAR